MKGWLENNATTNWKKKKSWKLGEIQNDFSVIFEVKIIEIDNTGLLMYKDDNIITRNKDITSIFN